MMEVVTCLALVLGAVILFCWWMDKKGKRTTISSWESWEDWDDDE